MATAKISTSPALPLNRVAHMDQQTSSILAAGLEALEMLDIGVAVTDSLRRVLFANQTAEQILISRDGLEMTDQGILQPISKWSNPSLGRIMRQAARVPHPDTPEARDILLAIRRPSGKRPFTLLVRSLRAKSATSEPGVPSVLVFVWDPELPEHDTEAGLRDLFGFTSCEARLANLLMKGKSVDDCCSHLEIRPSTVRMHLANLFAKTGVQRQGQLVSLLWKSVGMVRTKNERSFAAKAVKPPAASSRTISTERTDCDVSVRPLSRECEF
jgi:DNA-binding CsgD family transcriptional regulator